MNANDEEHEDRHGSLESVMNSRMSQPLVMDIIQCSRTRAKISSLCQRGVRKDQNIVKKVSLEKAKTATEESTVSLGEVVLRSQKRVRPDEVCEVSSTAEGKDTSSAEGAELARREIDEMTSRVPMTTCSSRR